MGAPARQLEKPIIRLPYYESIGVGTPSGGVSSALLAGYRYLVYSSPQNEEIELWGFHANFQNVLVRLQVSESRGELWIPFYSTQMTAMIGAYTQAEPYLLLPQPYIIPPRSILQFSLQNTDASNISNTVLTLVGSRIREVV